MATIHLIEGPVGAGKSTLAARLSAEHRAPHLNLDQWMVTLFSPDRPQENFMEWYLETKRRCLSQIWETSCELLNVGCSVVLELGLVQHASRQEFYHRVDGAGVELEVYLVDTPLELRRERVRARNANKSGTYKMEVSDEVFELANGFWQEPDAQECAEREIKIVAGS